ncbi:hypothetical protein GNI_106520 [Gregarina niphandrodes]|uniref:ENTH domain protein n=1 Tax=Gregarina niphandrodes TaxID=110365 RepID=A0A023B3T4_GRENI|nr:hypothetical protein GNI_106520 [Gregarina niphandrodes]EZG55992.1 hypothetical protein GNI_106520 [Gregarina niphandrodes]|eukprot:XP_011131380.1 hypothetical protein GNI_106520 [Gregarina niphandrodes]
MAAMTLRNLTAFRYHDGEREQGAGVRQKAEAILHLLEDEEAWKKAKKQAVQDSQTYSGGIENLPYFSPINHYNLYNRGSNPFFSGPEALPPLQIRQSCSDPPFGMPPATGGAFGGAPPFGGTSPFGAAPPFGGAAGSFGGGPAPGVAPSSRLYDPDDDFRTANPFSSMSKFQSEAEAADAWGLSKPAPSAGPASSSARPTGAGSKPAGSEPAKPTPSLIDLEPGSVPGPSASRNPIEDLLGGASPALPAPAAGELIDLFGPPSHSPIQPSQAPSVLASSSATQPRPSPSPSPNLLDL